MNLSRCLAIGLLAAFLFATTAGAGTEVMEIDPLSDKDLYHFKKEGPGKWTIDDTSDDVHTLIVCPKSKEDTGLLFIKRKFKNGFRFTMDVTGGSKVLPGAAGGGSDPGALQEALAREEGVAQVHGHPREGQGPGADRQGEG